VGARGTNSPEEQKRVGEKKRNAESEARKKTDLNLKKTTST